MWEHVEQEKEVHSNELFRFVVCYKCEGFGYSPNSCPFTPTPYAGYEQDSSTRMYYQEPRNVPHSYDNTLGWNSQASSSWEPSTVHVSNQWDNFQPTPLSSPDNFYLLGMKETLLSIYQMSQTLPMTRGQRDDFEANIEEQSSIIEIARMQGRELKAEEQQFFQDFVDYAHQWFNSLGATHDAPSKNWHAHP